MSKRPKARTSRSRRRIPRSREVNVRNPQKQRRRKPPLSGVQLQADRLSASLILKLFNGFGFCELVVLHSGAARLYVKLADYFPEGFAPTARNSPVYSGMYNIITFAVIVCCIRTINSHESTQL